MTTIFDILQAYLPAFASGLQVTLALAVLTWLLGIPLGLLLAVVAPFQGATGWIGRAFVFLFSATPMLVLFFWAHYPLQEMLDVVIDPFYTALGVLVLINAISVYSLVAAAAVRFPQQYEWAGQVAGLSSQEIFLHIRLPLLARQVAPPILNLQAFMLQCTVFASIISVEDLLRVAQRINSIVYKPIEIYTAMAFFYVIASIPLVALAAFLRRRFARDESER